MQPLFRLRFAVILSCILVLYGWAGQRDYEDHRSIECATLTPPRDYDPVADRCVHPAMKADRHATR